MQLVAVILAQDETPPAPQQQQQAPPGLGMLVPMIVLFGLFYLIMIRPMRRQERERMAMLSRVDKGDYITTSGGLRGSIVQSVKPEEEDVLIRPDGASKGFELKVLKRAIVDVVPAKDRASTEPVENK